MMNCSLQNRHADIMIGYGDNQPSPSWSLPYDPQGSDFELTLTYRGTSQVLKVSTGDLTISSATWRVSWPITTTAASIYPVGGYVTYRLRRIVPNGENRTYARGRVIITLDPILPGYVEVLVAGPQGPPGRTGAVGPQGPFSPGFGFAVYADSQFTAQSPLLIPAATAIPLSIDGLGPMTDLSQLKGVFAGVALWQNNKITPRAINDNYLARVNFTAQSLSINNAIKIAANIGGSVGNIYEEVELFGTDAGQYRSFSFSIPMYVKSTFVNNGAVISVTPDFDIKIWNASIEIVPLGIGE